MNGVIDADRTRLGSIVAYDDLLSLHTRMHEIGVLKIDFLVHENKSLTMFGFIKGGR